MHTLLKIAAGCTDVRCPMCGQGFLVFWARPNAGSDRNEQRRDLQEALREQHHGVGVAMDAEAHATKFEMAAMPAIALETLRRPSLAPAVPAFGEGFGILGRGDQWSRSATMEGGGPV